MPTNKTSVIITSVNMLDAFARTEFHRSQIQGFLYGRYEKYIGRHVIRDCTLDSHRQELWSVQDEDGSKYEALYLEKNIRIEEARMQLVADELNLILQNRKQD